jgi:hypothetical protein
MDDLLLRVPLPQHRIASRVIQGRAVILDPRTEELQRLNDVASLVWQRITERTHTIQALISATVDSFEVDHGTAKQDVLAFLAQLEEKGLLRYAEKG